jgi:hypothetical protein
MTDMNLRKIKDTDLQAEEKVNEKGGEILKKYKKRNDFYFDIRCNNGHVFTIQKRHLLYSGQFCSYYPCNAGVKCNWKDKQGFKIFKQRLTEVFSGDVLCIEKTPKASTKFLFKCAKCGHEWKNTPSYQLTTPNGKKRPPSCEQCSKSLAITIEKKNQYLSNFNICALDGVRAIKNMQSRFRYQCKKCAFVGNKTLNNIINLNKMKLGHCDCTYKKTHWTLEKLIKAGLENGYVLIDQPKMVNSSTIYKWKCEKGHITSFGLGSLKNGCNTCFNNNRFTDFEDVAKWLEENESSIKIVRGQNWQGTGIAYKFYCSICSREFDRNIHTLLSGSLCPSQSRSFGELVVEHFLKNLLGLQFVCNKKYDFLINKNGKKMELDGYNKEHKIAFEHNGIQHYEIGVYSKTQKVLEQRIQDDKLKVKLCEKMGIRLIVIPALGIFTPLNNLKDKIKSELIRLGILVPPEFDQINIDLKEMNLYHKRK